MPETLKKYRAPEVEIIQPVTFHEHLMLICGGSGSGKTTFGRYVQVLHELGVHNMDAIDADDFRGRLPLHKNADLTEAHAHHLRHALVGILHNGLAVAMIGVYGQSAYREDKRQLAKQLDLPFLTVLLETNIEERIRRVTSRPQGASDIATAQQVLEQNISYDDVDLRVNSQMSLQRIRAAILRKQLDMGLVKKIGS